MKVELKRLLRVLACGLLSVGVGGCIVLDYLEEWIIVPNNWMKTKYGKNVSLSHNASKQRAFVRPYIKYLFGLDTNYSSYNDDINRINRSAGSLDI